MTPCRWPSVIFCACLANTANAAEVALCQDGSCAEEGMPVQLLQQGVRLEPPSVTSLLQAALKRTCVKRSPVHFEPQFPPAMLQHASRGSASTTNATEQATRCAALGQQIHRDSGEEAADSFRAIDAVVDAALAAEPPRVAVAELCIEVATRYVTFNRPLTLLMNRTTHTMEHILQLLRLYPDDAALNEAFLSTIAGAASGCCPELTPFVARIGGFDVLFGALERFDDSPDVMMSAWRGLSDHSHNSFGAEIIANYGGPMQGIHFLVEQMRVHPEPGLAESSYDHLSLKYEIMQNVNGMLEHDWGNKYGAAFLREGFADQLLYSMRVEPDLRGTQDVACSCMVRLMMHDPSAAKVFADGSAVKLTVDAVSYFRDRGDETEWCGTTLGASYPVVPLCSAALLMLATANPANADEMLKLGLLGELRKMDRPLFVLSVAPLRAALALRALRKPR